MYGLVIVGGVKIAQKVFNKSLSDRASRRGDGSCPKDKELYCAKAPFTTALWCLLLRLYARVPEVAKALRFYIRRA